MVPVDVPLLQITLFFLRGLSVLRKGVMGIMSTTPLVLKHIHFRKPHIYPKYLDKIYHYSRPKIYYYSRGQHILLQSA